MPKPQSELSRDVDSKISKRQREYYHMEQPKKVLGMANDGKDKLIEMLKAGAKQLALPKPIERSSKRNSLSARISNPWHPRRTSRATTSCLNPPAT